MEFSLTKVQRQLHCRLELVVSCKCPARLASNKKRNKKKKHFKEKKLKKIDIKSKTIYGENSLTG